MRHRTQKPRIVSEIRWALDVTRGYAGASWRPATYAVRPVLLPCTKRRWTERASWLASPGARGRPQRSARSMGPFREHHNLFYTPVQAVFPFSLPPTLPLSLAEWIHGPLSLSYVFCYTFVSLFVDVRFYLSECKIRLMGYVKVA